MNWFKKYLYFLPILIFLPSLFVFFSGDDWFHLRITQINSIGEFLNFFTFSHTAQSAAFWRPLPTQVFFYVFQSLFGLTVWPYHLFVLICFAYSLYLVYRLAQRELRTTSLALIAVIIYAFSVSNFTRLYFLSAFQEISLVIFSLLCLLNFPISKIKALVFFVLALMSKETAVVIPLLLLLYNFKEIKKNLVSFLPIGGILLVYLYFRFVVFGSPEGDSYVWNFSPVKAANTLMWYVLWSFGAPELLVDYMGSGLRLVPKLFTDYAVWWRVIIPLLLGTIGATALLFIQKIRELFFKKGDGFPIRSGMTEVFKYILFFLITILPVLFLPSHKFALELGLPLVGFSLAIAWLMPKKLNILSFCFFTFFVFLNLSMNYLTYTRHYSMSRGEVSQSVYRFMREKYPTPPELQYFEFVNDADDNGEIWGQSKQISQALSSSDFFKVYYNNRDIKVYYQDMPEATPAGWTPVYLSTKQFLPNE